MRIQSEILRCSEISLYKTGEMDLISRKYRRSKSRVKRAIRLAKQAVVAAKWKKNEPVTGDSSPSAHSDNGKAKGTSTKKLEYFRNNEKRHVSEIQDEFYICVAHTQYSSTI